jgi:hypothetical protein
MEGKQADLFDEIGVDTDEAAGITYGTMEALLRSASARKGGAGAAALAGAKRPRA